MTFNRSELATGGIFIAFGLFFGGSALAELPIGSAFRMGPGYFPLVLAGLLIALGIAIAVRGAFLPSVAKLGLPWRGLVVILATPIVFGSVIQGLGLVPAVAGIVFLCSFASRQTSVRLALLLAIGLTVFCVGVFHYGLGLPLRMFGPWINPSGSLG